MKELTASLTRDGVSSKALDFGDWDISVGMDKTFFLKNPNSYAKADTTGIKNADKRLNIEMPDEIGPGKTVAVRVRIGAVAFDDPIEEELYFKDILDKISGRVVWRSI